jgi:hypothetical protein
MNSLRQKFTEVLPILGFIQAMGIHPVPAEAMCSNPTTLALGVLAFAACVQPQTLDLGES